MKPVRMDRENAREVATLMHTIRPQWWPSWQDAYGQLTRVEESIGTVGWFLQGLDGLPVGWALFRELRGYQALELECCGYDDHGVFKLEHKLGSLFDQAERYARQQGYTTLRTGMSSVEFNIDGKELTDIPQAMKNLSTQRVDYRWLLERGFRVMGIQPDAYPGHCHLILFAKTL